MEMIGQVVPPADWDSIIGMIIGFGLVVVLPMVGLLLAHQRKMAELLHGSRNQRDALSERVDGLEYEVARLKNLVTDHVLAADDRAALRSSNVDKET